MLKEQVTGSSQEAEKLGQQLALKLIGRGADKILAALDGVK
jgi:hydroxymethylbilane synthase